MSGPAAILRQVHHLRRHAGDLETRIEQAPKQLAIQQKKLANQEETHRAAHEFVKRMLLDIREKEGAVKATQAQIKKYEKQLEESTNKKEYDTLKVEIASEQKIIAKLEDEILALMGQHEEKTSHLPEVDKAWAKPGLTSLNSRRIIRSALPAKSPRMPRTLEELKTVEATLPDDIRPQYDRLIAAKGMDTLSGVKGRICSACYTEITSQMLSELKRDVFMLCKNCGRMLYLEA